MARPPMLEALAAVVAVADARRLLVLGAYRDEKATSGLAALVERLKPGGAARRRLGPFDHDEVAQILGLSAGWFAAAPRAVGSLVGWHFR